MRGRGLTAAVLLTFLGCGQSGDTVPATGTVTFNGKPADQAEVIFTPTTGRPASAVTDAQGRFRMSTLKEGDGAVPGEHVVSIAEYYPPGKTPPMPPVGQTIPSRYPAKYGDPTQSPFRAKVERGAKNDFQFDMTE
jgi:hypothetical protein